MIGIQAFPFGAKGLFSGAMLAFGSVYDIYIYNEYIYIYVPIMIKNDTHLPTVGHNMTPSQQGSNKAN